MQTFQLFPSGVAINSHFFFVFHRIFCRLLLDDPAVAFILTPLRLRLQTWDCFYKTEAFSFAFRGSRFFEKKPASSVKNAQAAGGEQSTARLLASIGGHPGRVRVDAFKRI